MNLNKHDVVGLCVIALQHIAHNFTLTGNSTITNSSTVRQEIAMYLANPVAEVMYKGLDAARITMPLHELGESDEIVIDRYAAYTKENAYGTFIVGEDDLHYLHAVIRFLKVIPLTVDNMSREQIDAERKSVMSRLLADYPKFEAELISGKPIFIMQLETPNTTHTLLSTAARNDYIITDIDEQVRSNAVDVMGKYLRQCGGGDLVVGDLTANCGISNRVGSIMIMGLPKIRGNFRFRKQDYLYAKGDDADSGSADTIHGSILSTSATEMDVNVMNIYRAVHETNKTFFGHEYKTDESVLTYLLEKEYSRLDLSPNTQKGKAINSRLSQLTSKLMETIDEYPIEEVYEMWCDLYKTMHTGTAEIKNQSLSFTIFAPNIHELGVTSDSMMKVFTYHYLAVKFIKDLQRKLHQNNFTLLAARLHPIREVRAQSLSQHLFSIFGEDVGFPLIDPLLEIYDSSNIQTPPDIGTKTFTDRMSRLHKTTKINLENLEDVAASNLLNTQVLSNQAVRAELQDIYKRVEAFLLTPTISSDFQPCNISKCISTKLYNLTQSLDSNSFVPFNHFEIISFLKSHGIEITPDATATSVELGVMNLVLEMYKELARLCNITEPIQSLGAYGVINLLTNFYFCNNIKIEEISTVDLSDIFSVTFEYLKHKVRAEEEFVPLMMGDLPEETTKQILRALLGDNSTKASLIARNRMQIENMYKQGVSSVSKATRIMSDKNTVKNHYKDVLQEMLHNIKESLGMFKPGKKAADIKERYAAEVERTVIEPQVVLAIKSKIQYKYPEADVNEYGFLEDDGMPIFEIRKGDLYQIGFINIRKGTQWKSISKKEIRDLEYLSIASY